MREFANLFFALGITIAAISVISLIQRLFQVGLIPVFADFIGYYRAVLSAVFQNTLGLIGVHPSQLWRDLYAVSLLGAASYRYGFVASDADVWTKAYPPNAKWIRFYRHPLNAVPFVLLVGFSLLGLIFLIVGLASVAIYVIGRMFGVRDLSELFGEEDFDGEHEQYFVLIHKMDLRFFFVVTLAAAFFAANAYAPSL